jgi:hypothetical protein
MSNQVLPPDAKRAQIYGGKNFNEVKYLMPDGSVLDALPVDIVSSVDTNVEYSVRLDNTSIQDIIFVGEAAIGSSETDSVWRIQKINTSSGVDIKWADGGNFTNQWSNRLGLIYE